MDESDLLTDLPLFRGLDAAAQAKLRSVAVDVEVRASEALFEQGDRTDAMYVVRSGRLQVRQGDVLLTELGRGNVIGELGLLTGEPRSASVVAVRDSTLVKLSQEAFDAVADVSVMTALAEGLARRLQVITPASSRADSPAAVIAVVGLDLAAPVRAVSAALVSHLRSHLRVVDPGRVDRAGLEQAELIADKVVLTASIEDEEWLDFCVRAADRLVCVSGEGSTSVPLPRRATGCDLVLTSPVSREERSRWEELLTPTSVHAIDGSIPPSALRPLAARIAGRSLGLVLGGGGARAFAHLGVLEELEHAGIAVDRVAGASVGAVIAAMAACGWDSATIDAQIFEHFVRENPIGDYTVPSRGLIRGRRTVSGLEATFDGLLVEELPREFRAVSVDLLHRQAHVHRSGRVSDVVASSLRLPGLYPPFQYRESLHVDGGVLDNLPVSTLAGPEGPVVAVSISFGGSGGARTAGAARPVRSGPPRVPGLGDTLMRTMMMGSGNAAEAAIALADVVLRPDATGVGLLEFHQIDRMRESGRAAARAALPEIEALLRG